MALGSRKFPVVSLAISATSVSRGTQWGGDGAGGNGGGGGVGGSGCPVNTPLVQFTRGVVRGRCPAASFLSQQQRDPAGQSGLSLGCEVVNVHP